MSRCPDLLRIPAADSWCTNAVCDRPRCCSEKAVVDGLWFNNDFEGLLVPDPNVVEDADDRST